MSRSMGMLQLYGKTYRVDRVAQHEYRVVRLLDDVVIGTFADGQKLTVLTSCDGEPERMLAIARAALAHGKTLWRPEASPSRRTSLLRGVAVCSGLLHLLPRALAKARMLPASLLIRSTH